MEAVTIAGAEILPAVEEANQKTIQRYLIQTKLGTIGARRERKLRYDLATVGTWLKRDFLDVTKQDVAECISALKRDEILQDDGEPYEISTKVTFLKILKPFFCWLHPEVGPVPQPGGQVLYQNLFVGWIKPGNYSVTVGPDEILNDSERSICFELCKDPRAKALFQTLYESAARPFEIIGLMRSDIEFDQDSASIHIRKGKNGRPRDISLLHEQIHQGYLTTDDVPYEWKADPTFENPFPELDTTNMRVITQSVQEKVISERDESYAEYQARTMREKQRRR